MPRFSLISICYCVAGFAGYFAIFAIASRNDSSFVSWLANSLGLLYGTVLYVSGLAAFYVACRSSWQSTTPAGVAVAIPFTFIPALIGLIGLVQGYINVYHIFSLSGSYPKPSEIYFMHSMVLVCLLVGLCLTFTSFALLATAMLVKSRRLSSENSASENGG